MPGAFRTAAALMLGACTGAAAAGQAEHESLSIWPGGAPSEPGGPAGLLVTERGNPEGLRDRYATRIRNPDLTVFAAEEAAGCALLVIPGGGYQRVVMDKEGYESAEWFAERGVSAFVLRYRLPGEYAAPRPDLPLADAQRALRVIRAQVDRYGIDPDCVGVIGFSAGGHLAGLLATASVAEDYEPVDPIDGRSGRPDFAVLVYPVISMQQGLAHAGSRERLLGSAPGPDAVERYSLEKRVMPGMAPVFLLHAADDEAVGVENSLTMHAALRNAGVATDLHIYAAGGHGFGLRHAADEPVADWPSLVHRWIEAVRAAGAD